MRARRVCTLLVLAVWLTTCAAPPPEPRMADLLEFGLIDVPSIERNARAAARTEIAEGRPMIWTIGRVIPTRTPPDPETGLPVLGITCFGSRENSLMCEAHNDEIRRAFRAGEIR